MEKEELQNIISRIISEAMRQPIFAPLALGLLNYDFIFTDNIPLNSPACVVYKEHKIYINPNSDFFFSIKTYNEKNKFSVGCAIILLHEILHPLLQHHKRMANRDPDLWNISGDIVINNLLYDLERESISQSIEKYGSNASNYFNILLEYIDPKWVVEKKEFKGKIEEEIYDILKKKKNTKSKKKYDSKKMQEFLEGKSQLPKEINDETESQQTCSVSTITIDNVTYKNIQFPQFDDNKPEEKEQAQKEQRVVEFCRNNIRQTLVKGCITQSLKIMLDKLLEVKIDWTRILRDSILTCLEDKLTYDWGMPTDEFLSNPFDLPYFPEKTEDFSKGIIALVRDQSGSISDENLQKASSVIWQSRNYYKGILLIDHDVSAKVTYFPDAKNMTSKDLDIILERTKCGGTSHGPAFEAINEFIKKDPDNKISMIIGITDLMSDLGSTQNIVPKTIPRVWIVSSSHSVPGLLGRVIYI